MRDHILEMLDNPNDELKEAIQRAICKGGGNDPDEFISIDTDGGEYPHWTYFDKHRQLVLQAIINALTTP